MFRTPNQESKIKDTTPNIYTPQQIEVDEGNRDQPAAEETPYVPRVPHNIQPENQIERPRLQPPPAHRPVARNRVPPPMPNPSFKPKETVQTTPIQPENSKSYPSISQPSPLTPPTPAETQNPPPLPSRAPPPPKTIVTQNLKPEEETEEEKSATALSNVFGVVKQKQKQPKRGGNRLKNLYAQPF